MLFEKSVPSSKPVALFWDWEGSPWRQNSVHLALQPWPTRNRRHMKTSDGGFAESWSAPWWHLTRTFTWGTMASGQTTWEFFHALRTRQRHLTMLRVYLCRYWSRPNLGVGLRVAGRRSRPVRRDWSRISATYVRRKLGRLSVWRVWKHQRYSGYHTWWFSEIINLIADLWWSARKKLLGPNTINGVALNMCTVY